VTVGEDQGVREAARHGEGSPVTTRIAVITGVSTGLGEALAACLLERDFEVVGIGRAASARLAAPRFRLVEADLAAVARLPPIIDPLFDEVAARGPALAVLVNNAAVAAPTGMLGALAADGVAGAIAVNLTAPVVIANAFLRAFRDAPGRVRVINLSSGAAARAVPGAGIYCITKAGLEMLGAVIAAEAGGHGAQVATIRPGIIDTPMQVYMRSQPKQRLPVVALFADFHASGRLAPPDAVAARIAARLVEGPIDNGRVYSIDEL